MNYRMLFTFVSLFVPIGFLAGKHSFHLADNFPEQDACDFGVVANSEYRKILDGAKVLRPNWRGGSLRLHGMLSEDYNRWINYIVGDRKNFNGVLAATHAGMRALGAVHVPWSIPMQRRTPVNSQTIAYVVDIAHFDRIPSIPTAVLRWRQVYVRLDPIQGDGFAARVTSISSPHERSLLLFYRPLNGGCP